nr:MAG: major capsid protein [Army ant associated microvirus 7]
MRHSVMTAGRHFASLPKVTHPRSIFDRSCALKTTFNSGYLVPIFVEEVLPGDTGDMHASLFSRLTTPYVPFMDNSYLDTLWFFVPNRLVWDNWQKFCGERLKPEDSTDYLVPQLHSGDSGFPLMSVPDYFGLPVNVPHLSVNALPFRALNLIYNEWIRDENLQDPLVVKTDDSADSIDLYPLFRRGKRHDYFTSCLPWPQKAPGVELPLGSSAPLVGSGKILPDGNFQFSSVNGTDGSHVYYHYNTSWPAGSNTSQSIVDDDRKVGAGNSGPALYRSGLKFDNNDLHVDLASATAVTINSLRQAVALQQYFEIDARGGTRYTEKLTAHFGVHSPDSRLQRPEYLGGTSTRISTIPVQQTSSTNDTTPQGNLAAFGVASHDGRLFNRSFVEHGWIIGLVNVRADLTYQQGIDRSFSRRTVDDFYWPSFAHLGEQSVLYKEIYADGSAQDDQVFGYQERYAEYRYKQSKITGKFRSAVDKKDTLDIWHLSQHFETVPALTSDFIQEKPPFSRVIAVQDEPEFLLDAFFTFRMARVMPVYSTPGLRRL